MAEEFEIIRANLLPVAGTITDNDMIIIAQGGRVKRALPSAMKGKQGDSGLNAFLGVNDRYILWKQGVNGAWQNLLEIEKIRGPKGEKPLFRKVGGTLQMKYEGEPDTAYINIFDREDLKMKFSDLTAEEVDILKLHFSDLTEEDIKELQKPARDAADELNKVKVAFEEFSKTTVLAESNRVKAEEQRVAIEKLRVEAETARAFAETLREDAEELRDQAETERINAETIRKEAENNRVFVEGLRVDEEAKRAAAEHIRIQSEQGRITEEGKRIEAENARIVAESLRDKSEEQRDEAEKLRDQSEIVRISDEFDRDTAEQERIKKETERNESEQERITKEAQRIQREDARIVEEQLRINAEKAREESETGREIAEEEREKNTTQAILASEEATEKANAATAITLDLNAHPMKIMGGIWFEWNVAEQKYENTGIQAKGDVGSSFRIIGRYDTLDELEAAVPDGADVDGVYAIGADEPFDYYAWLFVDGTWKWDNQGKLRGAEGKSSYEVWTEYPENEGKTKEQYFDWLSPTIDPETGRWNIQGTDMGVQAEAVDAHVMVKENTDDSYVLHVKSAKGEFDTPNLRGFDVKVREVETNTPDDYRLEITTVKGIIKTPNLKGRSGSAVIDLDHEPVESDTHYTYNGVQYAFSVGDEVRWYDTDSEAFVLFKLYAMTETGAVWEEMGSGAGSLPTDVILTGPSELSSDESESYIYLQDGYLKGKEE